MKQNSQRSEPSYELRWPAKRRPPESTSAALPALTDRIGPPGGTDGDRNRLLRGDNLPLMQGLLAELRGNIDLVYLDPPFHVGREFRMAAPVGEGNGVGADRESVVTVTAYHDPRGEAAYLQMLFERLLLIRELLAETGSLIVHVDWRAGHLVQALLDEVLGPGERAGPGRPGFRNEIVWGYGGGGALKTAYRRKHDNLFWYSRSDRWTFNPQFRPYTAATRQRGLTAVKGPRYALRSEGATLESWWIGPEVQKILSPTAHENLKYPTQKPEALLERIILGHSNPGELVADFFCGSGTTGAVAQRLGRRWLMADSSAAAVQLSRKRLALLLDWNGSQHGFDCFRLDASEEDTGLRTEPGPRVEAVAEGARRVRLRAAPEMHEAAALDLVDYWAVDWSYDGELFRHEWRSGRLPGSRGLIAAAEPGGAACVGPVVAVKWSDVSGREELRVLTGVPGIAAGSP